MGCAANGMFVSACRLLRVSDVVCSEPAGQSTWVRSAARQHTRAEDWQSKPALHTQTTRHCARSTSRAARPSEKCFTGYSWVGVSGPRAKKIRGARGASSGAAPGARSDQRTLLSWPTSTSRGVSEFVARRACAGSFGARSEPREEASDPTPTRRGRCLRPCLNGGLNWLTFPSRSTASQPFVYSRRQCGAGLFAQSLDL